MNVKEYKQMEIDIKELLWSLLSQWKAIVAWPLLAAIIISGAKFYKDQQN